MSDNPLYERVEDDDARRCQAVTGQGQCHLISVSGGDKCICHGGNKQLQSQELTSMRNYHLTKFQAKLQRHASTPNIKSLRDEVGILRMLMEEKLNRCEDTADLVMASGPIGDLVSKIERTVVSCHKLEDKLGQHLDKAGVLQFAQEVIKAVADCVADETLLGKISDEIFKVVGRIGEHDD